MSILKVTEEQVMYTFILYKNYTEFICGSIFIFQYNFTVYLNIYGNSVWIFLLFQTLFYFITGKETFLCEKKKKYNIRIFLKNGLIDFSAVDSRSNSAPRIFHFRVTLSSYFYPSIQFIRRRNRRSIFYRWLSIWNINSFLSS